MTADVSLAATWAELVDALTGAGLIVETSIPASPQPGTVVVTADEPYLERGDTFSEGGWLANVCLFVVFALAEDDAFTADSNTALLGALDAIPLRWSIKTISAPFKATDLQGLITSRVRISTTTQESEG